jgi:hypothetical protein
MGGDQEQDVLMCRDIWAFDIVALTCSALLRPLLCKTRFFAYSACSLAHERCRKLTGQFDCPRWGQYGLSCTRLHRCTTLYILLLSALCLYFSFLSCFPFTSQKMAH